MISFRSITFEFIGVLRGDRGAMTLRERRRVQMTDLIDSGAGRLSHQRYILQPEKDASFVCVCVLAAECMHCFWVHIC